MFKYKLGDLVWCWSLEKMTYYDVNRGKQPGSKLHLFQLVARQQVKESSRFDYIGRSVDGKAGEAYKNINIGDILPRRDILRKYFSTKSRSRFVGIDETRIVRKLCKYCVSRGQK